MLLLALVPTAWGQAPSIALVANAEGEKPVIAPNTWVEVKGANLSKPGDSRIWQSSDFVKNQLPAALDGVSVTVDGKSAYVYYISPTQVNILTPPDAMTGSVAVVVTNNGATSAPFHGAGAADLAFVFRLQRRTLCCGDACQRSAVGTCQPLSWFHQSGQAWRNGRAVRQRIRADVNARAQRIGDAIGESLSIARHRDRRHPGDRVLCRPGCARRVSVQRGCSNQRPERRQRDYGDIQRRGSVARWAHHDTRTATAPTSVTFYVSPTGNDFWSGTLPAPNSNNTDGPFASFDHARAVLQSISKVGLKRISVQFRAGTY